MIVSVVIATKNRLASVPNLSADTAVGSADAGADYRGRPLNGRTVEFIKSALPDANEVDPPKP
jgi:hypothetical protein